MDKQDAIFMRNFTIVLALLAGLAISFIILAAVIGSQVDYEDNVAEAQAVAARIAPVGSVSTGGQQAGQSTGMSAPPPQDSQTQVAMAQPQQQTLSGEQVFQQACYACHGTGAGGAPMLQAAAWDERLAQGVDTLVLHAINGFQGEAGIMPAKGGRMDLSDAEVRAGVEYMVSQVQ